MFCPQKKKKISRTFKISGTLIVIRLLFLYTVLPAGWGSAEGGGAGLLPKQLLGWAAGKAAEAAVASLEFAPYDQGIARTFQIAAILEKNHPFKTRYSSRNYSCLSHSIADRSWTTFALRGPWFLLSQ